MVYILIVTDPNLPYDIEEAAYKKLSPEDKKKYVLDGKDKEEEETKNGNSNDIALDQEDALSEEEEETDDGGGSALSHSPECKKDKNSNPEFDEFFDLIRGGGGKRGGKVDRTGE